MVDSCWLWAGSVDTNGYGHIYIRGSKPPYTPRQAHRVVYEALVAEIPEGMQLDHLCRVTTCINPEHLEPVTLKENVLRGIGITAQNAKKTHCPAGHSYAEHGQRSKNANGVHRRCGKCHALKEAERRMKLSQVN